MRQITEQMITALAPNAAAAANGRKISQKGGFVRLECSADDSFFLGECTGSGSNNYITTADFIDAAQPVFRCSCPSRQFPCKHSLGLMFEMLAGKPFATCEVPEDIRQKRDKKQAKAEKAEAASDGEAAAPAAPKVNKAARAKKLQKQLEGLELTNKLISDLLGAGLGTMGGTALTTYRQLAKQLGDYYLPGPQSLLNRLIIEIEQFQRDGNDSHYEEAVRTLMRLRALVKRATQYLSGKLASGDVEQEDNLLYEELGGVWKLSELAELGLCKSDARLAQLSFWVSFDSSRSEYIDTGCWADLDSGEVSVTQNLRPLKALKYIKQDDTVFGVAQVPRLCYYPGEGNRRVRWDGMELRELTREDLAALREHGCTLAAGIKQAKNILKNPLSDPICYGLIRFASIGSIDGGAALVDMSGDTILLGDATGMEPTVQRIAMLPDDKLLQDGTLLGGFFYDPAGRRMMLQPLSILTAEQVVRLLY